MLDMKAGNTNKSVVVLASGGMDSVTALYDAARKFKVVRAVSFDYGAKHNHREIPFAREHCARLGIPHQVISLGFLNDLFVSSLLKSGGEIPDGKYSADTMRQTVVPFRNGIMIAIGAGLAESIKAGALVIASHAGDHALYPDCRAGFMAAMADALRLGTYARIELMTPFAGMTKAGIAERGLELGVDFARTWSCYRGGNVHCGRCGTCLERREAFAAAGIADPTIYRVP